MYRKQFPWEARNVPSVSFRNGIVFIRRSHVLGLMLRSRGHLSSRKRFQVSNDHRSYERNLSNCVEKPEKVRTSTGFEPVTSRYRFPCLHSLILTRGRLEEFETVMQTRDEVESLRNSRDFSTDQSKCTFWKSGGKIVFQCAFKVSLAKEWTWADLNSSLSSSHLSIHYCALLRKKLHYFQGWGCIESTLIEKDHLGDWSPEKDYCLQLTIWQPVQKPSGSCVL